MYQKYVFYTRGLSCFIMFDFFYISNIFYCFTLRTVSGPSGILKFQDRLSIYKTPITKCKPSLVRKFCSIIIFFILK